MAQAKYKPTLEDRESVTIMAAVGIQQDIIARCVGIDPKTLRKHYAEELETAMTKANTKVAGTLFNKAVGGDTAACIFWCKTRLGWREKHDLNHEGGITVVISPEDADML